MSIRTKQEQYRSIITKGEIILMIIIALIIAFGVGGAAELTIRHQDKICQEGCF